jgi:UDP-N-acetyl-D-mannosaminuronate dehydrogenase
MPRASIGLVRGALGSLQGKRILLLGACYRPGVADTRYSPSSTFIAGAEAEGADVTVHDPLVDHFDDAPERRIAQDMPAAAGFDAIVFAVAHDCYRDLAPESWLDGSQPLVVDANGVLGADQIARFAAAGSTVKIVGRG